jgi:hypothetical protein
VSESLPIPIYPNHSVARVKAIEPSCEHLAAFTKSILGCLEALATYVQLNPVVKTVFLRLLPRVLCSAFRRLKSTWILEDFFLIIRFH